MQIFLDFEQTLLTDQKILLDETAKQLENCPYPITILTESSLEEARKKLSNPHIEIVSTLENKSSKNHKIDCPDYLNQDKINNLLKTCPILTAYTISEQTEIISYQPRLQQFYPNTYLKLVDQLSFSPSFLIIAIKKQDRSLLYSFMEQEQITILGEDDYKYLLKITATPSDKESWIKRLKKSPAIGIGDSFKDYSFLKHCDYRIAMANAEQELIARCDFKTILDNNHNGAMQFIQDFLAHQPF